MENNPSATQSNLERDRRFSEIARKLAQRTVVVNRIAEGELPLYLEAALITGYKVEKIADYGEEFPYWFSKVKAMGEKRASPMESEGRKIYFEDDSSIVYNSRVAGKDSIAISIERPKDVTHHSPFWDELKVVERKHAEKYLQNLRKKSS